MGDKIQQTLLHIKPLHNALLFKSFIVFLYGKYRISLVFLQVNGLLGCCHFLAITYNLLASEIPSFSRNITFFIVSYILVKTSTGSLLFMQPNTYFLFPLRQSSFQLFSSSLLFPMSFSTTSNMCYMRIIDCGDYVDKFCHLNSYALHLEKEGCTLIRNWYNLEDWRKASSATTKKKYHSETGQSPSLHCTRVSIM